MARDHILMITLSAILLINIIALVLLNNRVADQEQALEARRAAAQAQTQAPPRQEIRDQPAVRTLLLQDRGRCPECFDISLYATTLNDTILMRVEDVPPEGLAAFNATILPAIAFNQSLEEYPALLEGWDEVGYRITLQEGEYAGLWYVLPTHNPPYWSEADRRAHGLVSVTYVTMRSCDECFDVTELREQLAASRITPYRETTVDVESPEGRALALRYNLTAVPTVLLDREAAEYTNLQPGWSVVGSVEDDGTYVLRDLRRLNVVFYDLSRKRLMKP